MAITGKAIAEFQVRWYFFECLLFVNDLYATPSMVTVISVDGDNSVQKWIIGVACVFHLDTYTALNDATLYKV